MSTTSPSSVIAGGVLSTIYNALHPDGLKSLVCLRHPSTSRMTLWQTWGDEKHFDVDRLVDWSAMSARFIVNAFDMLRRGSHRRDAAVWDNM